MALVALSVVVPSGSVWATTSVQVNTTALSGDTLSVTGVAAFADEPFVVLGSDPAHDAVPPGPTGLDLTGAAVRSKVNGDLEFQWTLTGLPPVVDGLDMTFLGWSFCVVGEEKRCFELDAGRYYHSQWPPLEQTGWSGQLWSCANATCAWFEQTGMSTPVDVTVQNVPGSTAIVSAAVPGSAIGASPEAVVSPVSVYPGGAAFATVWQWHERVKDQPLPGGGVYPFFGDGLTIGTDYAIPARTVSLALVEPGADPQEVAYTTSAALDASGSFTGSVPTGGLTGPKSVYARACFGDGNCAFASRDVTL